MPLSLLLRTALSSFAVSSLFTLPAAAEGKFKVATTFTVLADMAAEVGGDKAEVVSITKPGAEIHGYQPTPQDLVRVQDADMILWNGLNLELWFARFLQGIGDVPSVVLTEGIEPISITSGNYEGKPNPHAWMGLDTALIYVDNIARAFAEHDPANSEEYLANAEAYKAKLKAALDPLRERVKSVPPEKRWLATCEGAFSYIARDLGLRELYLWPMNADQTGTPRQVFAVVDAVRENDIPVVFCESTVNTAPAEVVARETGARYGGVLYVDSLSEPDGPVPTFLDLLTVTTRTIVEGLEGDKIEQ